MAVDAPGEPVSPLRAIDIDFERTALVPGARAVGPVQPHPISMVTIEEYRNRGLAVHRMVVVLQ